MQKIELITFLDLERLLLESLRNNELPDCFLYSDLHGAHNFELLCKRMADSAGISVFEHELLNISSSLPQNLSFVYLGVGSSGDERFLRTAFQKKIQKCYFVDSSSEMVEALLTKASSSGLDSTGIISLIEDLGVLSIYWKSPALLCLLGNRFSCIDAEVLLELIRENLDNGDYLLFNCTIIDSEVQSCCSFEIDPLFKSMEHVRFNAGPLISHGASCDDFQFHLDLLLSGTFAGPVYRTRKRINFLKTTELNCVCGSVQFNAGEYLCMGSIFKYTDRQVRSILTLFNFTIEYECVKGTEMIVLCRCQKNS